MKTGLYAIAAILLFGSCIVSFRHNLLAEETSMYYVQQGSELAFENTNGDLYVSVWNSDSVQIKTLVYGDSTQGIPEDMEIKFDQQESMLSVTVEYPSNSFALCQVDIIVSVPEGMHYVINATGTNGDIAVYEAEKVDVKTTNGDITVEASCSDYLETTNGDISAELPLQCSPLVAETTNGDVFLKVPSDMALSAETVNGDLTVNGIEFDKSVTVDGSGENEVVVKTVNGDVVIEHFSSGT